MPEIDPWKAVEALEEIRRNNYRIMGAILAGFVLIVIGLVGIHAELDRVSAAIANIH